MTLQTAVIYDTIREAGSADGDTDGRTAGLCLSGAALPNEFRESVMKTDSDINQKTPDGTTEKAEGRKSGRKWLIVGLVVAGCCLIMIFVLLRMGELGPKNVRFRSSEFPITVVYDTNTYEHKLLQMDRNLNRIERFGEKKNPYTNYLSVSAIDPTVDLEETLASMETDYHFEREDNAAYGAGNYPAIRIFYTDTTGEREVLVTYYYDLEHELFITVSSDENQKDTLAKMLAGLTITEE